MANGTCASAPHSGREVKGILKSFWSDVVDVKQQNEATYCDLRFHFSCFLFSFTSYSLHFLPLCLATSVVASTAFTRAWLSCVFTPWAFPLLLLVVFFLPPSKRFCLRFFICYFVCSIIHKVTDRFWWNCPSWSGLDWVQGHWKVKKKRAELTQRGPTVLIL